jgi:hypothetical protein
MTRKWLLRDAWANEHTVECTAQSAADEAQRLATARGVPVTYRAKLTKPLPITEAPTARMKRP